MRTASYDNIGTPIPLYGNEPSGSALDSRGHVHLKGCLLDMDHTGKCETASSVAPYRDYAGFALATPDPTTPAPTPTLEIEGIAVSDFSAVSMNQPQRDVARLLEIRYRSLAREILSLVPNSAHRERALGDLLASKMMLVLAISRSPETKL